MVTAKFPLRHAVERIRRSRLEADSLGNPTYVESVSKVLVAGWHNPVPSSDFIDEPVLAGHKRTVISAQMYAPSGEFIAEDKVRLTAGGTVFDVIGQPNNLDHGPFGWAPGLEVVNLGVME